MRQVPQDGLRLTQERDPSLRSVTGLTGMLKEQMTRRYLHLSVYSCDKCAGPVIKGSLAIRENEISKETDIKEVGAICLSCGHRQSAASEGGVIRQFPPVEWQADGSTAYTAAQLELEGISRG